MKPDTWLIVKIKTKEEILHKVVAGWNGGYLSGDSWKSACVIKGVVYENEFYRFFGFSGTVYECHENAYGQRICNSPCLERIINACEYNNAEYEILHDNTDWLNYKLYEKL